MKDSCFLRDLSILKMEVEHRRDDYRGDGRSRAVSTCIQCLGILQDLELLIMKDMKTPMEE